MFKKSMVILFLLMGFGFNAHAQDKCNTYSEPFVGVTFCAPPKWSIKKKETEPYADIFGETRNGLAPNINMQTASIAVPLTKYVDGGVEIVLKTKVKGSASKIEVKSKSVFVSGVESFKVVYNVESSGYNLRLIQYFFKGLGNTKIIITATLPTAEADELEKIVDASLNTFRVTDKPIKIGTR